MPGPPALLAFSLISLTFASRFLPLTFRNNGHAARDSRSCDYETTAVARLEENRKVESHRLNRKFWRNEQGESGARREG